MTLRACAIALLAVLVAAGPALAPTFVSAQGKEVFIPLLEIGRASCRERV